MFYNQNYEPMIIESMAELVEPWVVYGEGSDEVTDSITSIDYQEIFPGLMDTAKMINFYDKKHEKLNIKSSVKLSKNFGLIDVPYFYWNRFNNISSIKTNITHDNVYGFEYPFDEVFGRLEIGDESIFYYSSDSNPYHSKERLIEKEISDHSVKYVFEECRKFTENTPKDTTNYVSSTKTEKYPMGYMPGEIVSDTNISDREYYMSLEYGTLDLLCGDFSYFKTSPQYRKSIVPLDGRRLRILEIIMHFQNMIIIYSWKA